MPISRERYETGLTAQQFRDSMRENQERYDDNVKANTFTPEDLQFFKEHPISIAAIAEDWCPDVIHFLPVAIKLAQESPDVTLRIFKRDDNLDLMSQYLKDGEFQSVPTLVVYDQGWNELGFYSERPAAATKQMAEETLRFARENAHLEGISRTYANMPEETRQIVRAHSTENRWSHMLEWNRIFIEEFKQLVAGGVASAR
jgi:thiol-disulfide isomerase/thioredoxin